MKPTNSLPVSRIPNTLSIPIRGFSFYWFLFGHILEVWIFEFWLAPEPFFLLLLFPSSFNSFMIPSIDLTAKGINNHDSHAEWPPVRFMPTCISAHQHWTWQIILLLNHGAVAGASRRTSRNAEPGPMSGRHWEMDTEMTATRFRSAVSLMQKVRFCLLT